MGLLRKSNVSIYFKALRKEGCDALGGRSLLLMCDSEHVREGRDASFEVVGGVGSGCPRSLLISVVGVLGFDWALTGPQLRAVFQILAGSLPRVCL